MKRQVSTGKLLGKAAKEARAAGTELLEGAFEGAKEKGTAIWEQAQERLSSLTTDSEQDAIALLKKDHDTVKGLFDQFENTENRAEKKKLVAKAIDELKIHATIEEELFYPAVRQRMDDDEGLMDEADEEHHVAKVLIAELEAMTGKEEHYDAKFIVLAENIRHHIKEEEEEMLPKARKTDIDFEALGALMLERKEELKQKGVPPDAEAKMVKKSGLRGDSPAKHAAIKIRVPIKTDK
jgi:hypothetical protein